MNKTLISILLLGFLLLFIFSPFSALAGLMLVLLLASFYFFISNLLQAIISNNLDSHEPRKSDS